MLDAFVSIAGNRWMMSTPTGSTASK